MKASQLITHPPSSPTYRRTGLAIPEEARDHYGFFRPTEEVRRAWEQTAAIAQVLDSGVVLFQCPASFCETEENVRNLRRFFDDIQRGQFLMAWEPRGDWAEDTVRGICKELGLLHVTDPLVRAPLWGEPWYLRLHGGTRYLHRYTREELARLRALVEGRRSLVFFNNASMLDDARSFAGMLGAAP
jgi:uncharacterized protein YecE (DUF72 family)